MSNYAANSANILLYGYIFRQTRKIAQRERNITIIGENIQWKYIFHVQARICATLFPLFLIGQSMDNPTASFAFHAFQQIQEINSQVAQFRDLLINIGQPRDCPELREKIRRLRRNCVEACKSTSQLVLPHVQRWVYKFIGTSLINQSHSKIVKQFRKDENLRWRFIRIFSND